MVNSSVANNKIALIIPSYNETKNVLILIKKVFKNFSGVKIIIVDDSSVLENKKLKILLKNFKNVLIISRLKKLGRGSAVLDGIKIALKDKAVKYIFEMDSDLAHDPKEMVRFISKINSKKLDLIIGSRYLLNSRIRNITIYRILFSKIVNKFLSFWLGIPISDYTSGYRLYTRKSAEFLIKTKLKAKGFISLSESAYKLNFSGFKLAEVPITWNYRKHGKSTLNFWELISSLFFVLKLRSNNLKVSDGKKNIASVLLLFLLTLFYFNSLVTHSNQMIDAGDIIGQYSIWRSIIFESIFKFHQIPFWNSYEFSGNPLIANPLVGFFYLPNLIYLIFPSEAVFGYKFIIDVFLIGFFTYLFVKLITLNRYSAMFSALLMMFSGQIIARVNAGHVANVDVIVWVPLLFYFSELLVRNKKYHISILMGFVISLMVLAGHLQFAYFGFIANFIYFILRVFAEKNYFSKSWNVFDVLFKYILSFVIGISLSAVQLLMSWEFMQNSIRATKVTYDFSQTFSFPVQYLISFIFPNIFGSPLINDWWGKGNFWEYTTYLGLFPLFLLLLSIFKSNKYNSIFWTILIISLLISFGSNTPFFIYLYKYVPLFDRFRIPATFLYIYVFSVAVICGITLSRVINEIKSKNDSKFIKKILNFYSIFLLIASGGFILTSFGKLQILDFLYKYYKIPIRNYSLVYSTLFYDYLIFIIQTFCIFAILILFKKMIFSVKILIIIIFGSTIINLFYFGMPLVRTKDPNEVYNSSIINILDKYKNYRIVDLTGYYSFILQKHDFKMILGYNPNQLVNYRNYVWQIGEHLPLPFEPVLVLKNIQNFNLLKNLYVKIIISPDKMNDKKVMLLAKDNENYIYKITDQVFPAYIVSDTGKKYMIKNINYYGNNKIGVNFVTPFSGKLVLSEIWYPGWKASVNGKIVDSNSVNKIFRSTHVDKGKNKVLFYYYSKYFLLGLTISVLTFVLCIISLIYLFLKKKI